jgi:GT2 family glycosyltransferase/glycosyltransferase involved in cell wall biosynthesis
MPPTASIIVLSYNNLNYTRLCLESIVEKTNAPDYELIIVDNASTDGAPLYLKEFGGRQPNVKLILNSSNLGFARGNNMGAEAAEGDYLVFLNNDTVVTCGWLDRLIRYLADPAVGMVGPVTNNSGNETRIQVEYFDLDGMERFANGFTTARQGQAFEIGMLPLMCAVLRRNIWEEVGSFDERFGVGMFEDDDYSLRMKQKGYKLLCAEDVFIHHWGSAGFSLVGFKQYWKLYLENLEKFESKWGIRWKPHRFRTELLDEQYRMMWEEKRDLALQVIKLRDQLAGVNQVNFDIFRLKRFIQRNLMPPGSARARIFGPGLRKLNSAQKSGRAFASRQISRLKTVKAPPNYRSLRVQLGQELDLILAEHSQAREVVFFVPTIPWNTPLFQRPHQMALAMARQGCLVFFLEEPTTGQFEGKFHRIAENLYIIGKGPLDIFRRVASPVVFTLAYNRSYLSCFTNPRVVYEYIDDLSVLLGDMKIMKRNHDELVKTADVVLATAGNLYQEIVPTRQNALLNPNAVDREFILQSLNNTHAPPTEILQYVRQNTPIIGYYGALAKWFDYPLLSEAAQARPDYLFLLIGPNFDDSLVMSGILTNKNILWLDSKPYTDLPRYLKYFDVATIPFQLNTITHATSPLKLFEYMTAGKPIVTTAMKECEKYQSVLVAKDSKDFVNKIDEALKLREEGSYLQTLKIEADENTWDLRAKAVLDALPTADR